jgi:transposase InsO family protein
MQDGSNWSVLADWEATHGIHNDIMHIDMSPPPTDAIPLPYELEDLFKGDVFFEPIVRHLLGHNTGSNIAECRRAKHRAQGFIIEHGKLWRISTKANDRVSRTECIPKAEAFDLAMNTHRSIGHFKSVDILKLHLHDRYFWPRMDNDCRQVALECPECKNFGPAHHNALLQPIRRSRPFSLICGDYMSLPSGHGGFKQVGLYVDVYSGFVWGTKLKSAGTAKSTINSLQRIFLDFATPSSFMADGGTHFNNGDVQSFCTENGVQHITTAAYAPWCNGLIEHTNQLLLGRLRRLCAPNIDEYVESDTPIDPESMPNSWPLHFDEALRQINDRIRPSILRSPRELLFGLALTPEHKQPDIHEDTSIDLVDVNLTLADALRMNAHLLQLETTERQKSAWDNRIPATEFTVNDLVQFYDSRYDTSYKSINKLIPRWSKPHIITGKSLNSYSLSTLHGTAIPGSFHSRRLRTYIPLRGTDLDASLNTQTTLHHDNETDLDHAVERMETECEDFITHSRELTDRGTE